MNPQEQSYLGSHCLQYGLLHCISNERHENLQQIYKQILIIFANHQTGKNLDIMLAEL